MADTPNIDPALRRPRRGRRVALAIVLAASLSATACGTRTERAAPVTRNQAATGGDPSAGMGTTPQAGNGPSAAGPSGSAPTAAVSRGGAAGATTGGAGVGGPNVVNGRPAGSASTPGGSTGPTSPAAAGASSGVRQNRSDEPAPSAPGVRPPGGQVPAPAPGATTGKSPVVIGHVGTLGGPAGVALAPILGGVQLWVKYINKVGGLNGHEVKLVVYDDGGDPARHRAQLQQAVEKNGAIAFLANTDPITGQSGLKYLEDKQIPHVGTTNGVPWAYDSPMYFPQQSDGEPGIISWLAGAASQMVPAGKTKLASLTCLEAQGCADADRIYSTVAKQFGFDLVYRSRASIAQPDYTAECLNARSAGATTFMVILDQNSVARVASACARQGYKPNFATIGTIIDNKQKDDPNLAGMVGAMNVFPWFQTGTPAADEFRHALADVGKQISATVGTTIGWTAGKLLQKAATALPEPPTNAAILQGLWAMKGETLGGITGPLTFTQGKPATKETCWFNLALKEQWVSPDDFKIHCL